MQLPLPADALVSLGLGAMVAVVAVIALVFTLRRHGDDSPSPTPADWTGENAEASDAPAVSRGAVVRRTVAEAIAARRADTYPFPILQAVDPLPSTPAPPEAQPAPEAERTPEAEPTGRTDRRGVARDRLLSVLLDDPLRAVGAAVDLLDCQERMDRLAGALSEERAKLRDVLGRLARSGLRADQLAKLSGLSHSDVTDLLRHR